MSKMNTIRKYITQVVGEEDEMEVDNSFTEKYLSQFVSIDRQTIEVMVDNGYQTRESLLAFDLKEDLPQLPDLNMAQKSLLRKVLTQFLENENFESKIEDMIGGEDLNFKTNSTQMKRKRESTSLSSPPMKYRTTDASNGSNIEDGLTPRMRRMVRGRKPIHSNEDSDFLSDSDQFRANNDSVYRSRRSNASNPRQQVSNNEDDSEESEEEEEEVESPPQLLRTVRREVPRRQVPTPPITPKATRNSIIGSTRTSRTPNPRVSTTPSIVKTETKSSAKPYVPTPTELEVRERLEQKKAVGRTPPAKRGRKPR